MGLLDQDALNYGLITAGLSMLANNTSKRNPTQAIGMGGLAGLQGFAQAKQMAEAQRMKQLQELQMTMQLQALMKKSQKEAEIETMVNQSNYPDLKQAYMLGGPEKAFEFMQQQKWMSDADKYINPPKSPDVPVRQFQPEGPASQSNIRGNFDVSSPEKVASLERMIGNLKMTNPAEYQNVISALQEQGLIKQPPQSPDYQGLMSFAARGALAGMKGAPVLMDMAKQNTLSAADQQKADWERFKFGNIGASDAAKLGIDQAKLGIDQSKLGLDWQRFDWEKNAPKVVDGVFVTPPSGMAPGGTYIPPGMAAPKGSPAAKEQQAKGTMSVIKEAENLLDKATGSLFGSAVDATASAIGIGTPGAEAIAQLKVLEAKLIMEQPRMEGPQSDKDAALYRQAAAQIGDPTVPAVIKRAALKTLKEITQTYGGGAAMGTNSAKGVIDFSQLPKGK